MKKLLLFPLFSLLLVGACKQNIEVKQTTVNFNADSVRNVVLATDRHWNDTAQVLGFVKAKPLFADDSAINYRQGGLPIVGKSILMEHAAADTGALMLIQWEPRKSEVSSGDLAYTLGNWQWKTKTDAGADTIYRGVYCTIWKRQSDGTWKFVFDGGNDTPGVW